MVMAILLLAPFAVLSAYAAMHRGAAPSHAACRFTSTCWAAFWWPCGITWASTTRPPWPRRSIDPQRTYPLAMAGAVAMIAFSYVLPIGAVALTGLDAGRWSTGGWADVARAVFGSGAAGAVPSHFPSPPAA